MIDIKKLEVLDYMPLGAFVLKNDYTVLFWNRCLEQWTGILKKDIVDKNIGDYFPNLNEAKYSARLQSIFQGGPPAVFSSQLHKYIISSFLPDRQKRVQHTIVTAMRDEDEDRFYALFAIQDVSELSHRIRQYSILSNKLKESNNELEAFTYSVSHDLRAPLRALVGFSKILMQKYYDKLEGDGHRYLNIIQDSALEMSTLIEDLLKLSRINRSNLELITINTKEFICDIFKELKSYYEKRDIEFIISDLPQCEADPVLFKQLLINILDNALKYSRNTEKTIIEVGFTLSDKECIFFIKDNGTGFNMDYIDKIFGVFERLHSSTEYKGTGVGLSIVKRIIKRHGGRIWAEAEEGKGATFYFALKGEKNGTS
ncbi:histidine kinase [Candidatus Magnetomoraceae bacterium gMMP-1]